jgi:hypothetical protein
MQKRFPKDLRNELANRALSRLALSDDTEVSAGVSEILTKYEGSTTLQQAFKEEARHVGFKTNPLSLNMFLWDVLENIAVAEKADGAGLAAVLPQGGAR